MTLPRLTFHATPAREPPCRRVAVPPCRRAARTQDIEDVFLVVIKVETWIFPPFSLQAKRYMLG